MKVKSLQGTVNNLCAMATGWRMANDENYMKDKRRGEIFIDILKNKSKDEQGNDLDLHIDDELYFF